MSLLSSFAYIYWNPNRVAFTIPLIDKPVVWYGLCFVLGFVIAYLLLLPLFKEVLRRKDSSKEFFKKASNIALYLVDKLTWYVVAGTIIGARLGHVFFYDWPYYKNHLLEIFQVWNGGLASHGGTLGVIIALILYQRSISKKFPEFTLVTLFDLIVIPIGLVACLIRIGNFINQEVIGIPSTLPWAIIFGDAADGSSPIPRHPVQLYEALIYFSIFVFLLLLRKFKKEQLRPGMISGIFLILVFGSRFFVEFLKKPQSIMIDESFLQTGQYLSFPFIVFGIFLFFYSSGKTSRQALRAARLPTPTINAPIFPPKEPPSSVIAESTIATQLSNSRPPRDLY